MKAKTKNRSLAGSFCWLCYATGGDQRVCKHEGTDELAIKRTRRFLEKYLIKKALQKTYGNRALAADALGISPRALRSKMKSLDLEASLVREMNEL